MEKATWIAKLKPHHLFLCLSFLFGFIWMVIVPPYQVADEYQHLYRSYEISEGRFITKNTDGQVGNYLPKEIRDFQIAVGEPRITRHEEIKESITNMKNAAKIYASSGEKIFYQFPGAALYHPIVYFPQALGIKIGSLLNLNMLFIFYLGRLVNLAVYTALTYFAIKLIPHLKYTLLLLALMPMTMIQAASMSADALTNGTLFLFLSYVMYLTFTTDKITRRQLIAMFVLAVIIAAVKNAYFLFCLLPLVIPKTKFESLKQYKIYMSSILLLCLFVVLSWTLIVKFIDVPLLNDPKAQLMIILHDPIQYMARAVSTFIHLDYLSLQFFGVYGWGEVSAPIFAGIIFLSFLIGSVVVEVKNLNYDMNTAKRGLFVLVISLLTVGVIETTLFLTWKQEAKTVISGLQGRYFIPVVMILLYAIYLLTPLIKKLRKEYLYSVVILIVFLMSLERAIKRFW